MTAPTWPKTRPTLSAEQISIMEDWYLTFLGDVLPGRFAFVDKFNHRYPLRSARKQARTLEIGPGNGSHLQVENLADQQEYVAVELRESLSRQIQDAPSNVRIVVGDCEQGLDFPTATFDRVIAIHVLEHLANLPRALAEVYRVLKPTGRFSVVIPCEGGGAYAVGRALTIRRTFQRRYGVPYTWLIRYEHINRASEVLAALGDYFRVEHRAYFPLHVPSVHLNLVVGLTLRPLRRSGT